MGRVVVWLAGSLVVLLTTITGLNLLNPEPIPAGSPLATQTTDGMSLFSAAGEAYIELKGELFIRVGGDTGPATALGLPDSGQKRVSLDPAADVTVILPGGQLIIEDIGRIEVFVRDNIVSSVELAYTGRDVVHAIKSAGFSASSLGIREEDGVRVGARLSNGELDITVRAID